MILTTLGIASVVFVATFTWRTVTKTGGDVAARREAIIEAWVNIFIGFGINFIVNLLLLPMMTQGGRVDPVANFWGGWVYTAVSVLRQYSIRRWFDTYLHAFNKRASIALGKFQCRTKVMRTHWQQRYTLARKAVACLTIWTSVSTTPSAVSASARTNTAPTCMRSWLRR